MDSKLTFNVPITAHCRAYCFHLRSLRHIRPLLMDDMAKLIAVIPVLWSSHVWTIATVFWHFFNTIFVSSHMYPENPEETQVIVGFMNMGCISDTARNRTRNLFHPKRELIPLGHSDGHLIIKSWQESACSESSCQVCTQWLALTKATEICPLAPYSHKI